MQVKLFGNLRQVAGLPAGQTTVDASGATAGEVLLDLCAAHPELRAAIFDGQVLARYVRVMVNGRDIELTEGLNTEINENDQLAIFPPIAGGNTG